MQKIILSKTSQNKGENMKMHLWKCCTVRQIFVSKLHPNKNTHQIRNHRHEIQERTTPDIFLFEANEYQLQTVNICYSNQVIERNRYKNVVFDQ